MKEGTILSRSSIGRKGPRLDFQRFVMVHNVKGNVKGQLPFLIVVAQRSFDRFKVEQVNG